VNILSEGASSGAILRAARFRIVDWSNWR